MKSIGARLALWYAGAATLTTLCLFVTGYYLLQNYLVHGLDFLNRAQFEQVKAHLGTDLGALNASLIETRIRETTNYSSVLFFIMIDQRGGPVRSIFYSTNLHGREIPDVPGRRVYDTQLAGVGELRAAEFLLGPFDVTIATPLGSVRATMHDYAQVGAWLLTVMVGLSAAIGLGLSRVALRPVRSIRDTANHISSDNLSERIPVGEVRDEISELALLLNRMFDRLESAFDQIRRFTGDASHELKTPLSLIRLQAEKLLVEGSLNAANEEAVHVQLEEVARLNQIIEELLFLSRAEARNIELTVAQHDPEVLLNNFSQDARVLSEHRGLELEVSHTGSGTVLVEPRWLRRVLLNILANAINASPPAGRIVLSSAVERGVWRVWLDDEGAGVPAGDHEKIFERFFRLPRTDGRESTGSGLGLAICRSIISLHHGKIWSEKSPRYTGLRVVFTLPAIIRSGEAHAAFVAVS